MLRVTSYHCANSRQDFWFQFASLLTNNRKSTDMKFCLSRRFQFEFLWIMCLLFKLKSTVNQIVSTDRKWKFCIFCISSIFQFVLLLMICLSFESLSTVNQIEKVRWNYVFPWLKFELTSSRLWSSHAIHWAICSLVLCYLL